MKCFISVVCALSVLVALTHAAPMPQDDQVIDNVIQNVTSTAFRVFGRAILQSGALTGGNSGGGGVLGGGKVSVVLPTFGPDDDDYEDEDEEEGNSNSIVSSSEATLSSSTESSSTKSSTDDVELNILDIRTNNDVTDTSSPASAVSRTKRDVRRIRAAEDQKAETDQDAAASGGNALNPSDDLANVEDDADRDKRFLPFGGAFGGGHGGSSGGSGNFLFDIIRSTADGAARAAGTVYRMIAGTENSGLSLTAATRTPKLVAGSGATEETDEKDNAPIGPGGVAEIDVAKGGDGYTEGIPGPITRLFVLANRGLANLIQDLILRLAQTSERIVNFKARLITALI